MMYLASENLAGFLAGRRFSIDNPAPTVMARGMGGDAVAHWRLNADARPDQPPASDPSKPPYRVPLLAEIIKLPWNGLTVCSTFSGAGGSCTGYRMAGFRVLWANEFMPAAIASYKANYPDSIIDGRDIHEVTAEDILKATGLAPGELDLFDGSPPCQAFSMAGKRHKKWNDPSRYGNGVEQCNEQLFPEYIRLLRGLKPKTFVAENVSGMVKGVAKGFFKETLRDLRACGYRVRAALLDAQWLGVPQARQRIIFVGVREDLNLDPVHPKPFPYRYSVRDALPHIGRMMLRASFEKDHPVDMANEPMMTVVTSARHSGLCRKQTHIERIPSRDFIHDTGGAFNRNAAAADAPCPAITIGANSANSTHFLVAGEGDGETKTSRSPDGVTRRKLSIPEVKRLCGFPDDYTLTGSYNEQWARLGNSVPPVMMYHVASCIRDHVLLKVPNDQATQTTHAPNAVPKAKPKGRGRTAGTAARAC